MIRIRNPNQGSRRAFLRHRLRDAAGGDGGDDLLPDQGPHAEENAPSPLLQSEGRSGERWAAKLDNYNLGEEEKRA